jgi:acyl-CoA dehydrogenase
VRPVPPFTERHEALRAEMRAFVEGELRPLAPEWEAARWFPDEVFGMLAERGWLGLKYGPDADWVADAVLCEELPRAGSGGLAAGIGAHTGIATPPLATFGTEAQQRHWLEPAIRGEKIAALAITEPDTGSDVAAIRTRAERVDGGWVVNGAKTFITNGVRADFYVTAVRTRPEPGHGSLSFLVVEAGEGVSARPLEKLGWHASDTAEIAFEDVAVPDDALLGEEGRGFHLMMGVLDKGRVGIAALSVGIARAGLEAALGYARERRQFGRAVAEFQGLQWLLADMATDNEAARLLTWEAARKLDAGEPDATMACSMAKRFASDVAVARSADAVQVFGGSGYIKGFEVERLYRDAKICQIYEGTNQIQRSIIARELLRG